MSVLIRGMEMPKSCSVNTCLLCTLGYRTKDGYTEWCRRPAWQGGGFRFVGMHGEENKRPDDCPLISIPPHGRLIDADELRRSHCLECSFYPDNCLGDDCDADSVYHIDHAKTIIEAEV